MAEQSLPEPNLPVVHIRAKKAMAKGTRWYSAAHYASLANKTPQSNTFCGASPTAYDVAKGSWGCLEGMKLCADCILYNWTFPGATQGRFIRFWHDPDWVWRANASLGDKLFGSG